MPSKENVLSFVLALRDAQDHPQTSVTHKLQLFG